MFFLLLQQQSVFHIWLSYSAADNKLSLEKLGKLDVMESGGEYFY